MIWSDEEAPTLDQFEALARDCFAKLPPEFRRLAADIAMRIGVNSGSIDEFSGSGFSPFLCPRAKTLLSL